MEKQKFKRFISDRLGLATKAVRALSTCLAVVAFCFFAVSASPAHASTGINPQINYQGRLLDSTGATVADGTYNMEFKIYQDGTGCVGGGSSPCGGTLKWTETRTSTNKVTVRNGYFSVQLGEVTAFGSSVDWNQSSLWLSVNIGGTGTPTWDGEMTPFRRLGADAYAMNAQTAQTLQGVAASGFVQIAPAAAQTDSSTVSTVFLNKTGASGNILELQKSGTDVFTVGNSGALTMLASSTTNPVVTINRSSDGTAGLQVRVSGVGGTDPGNNLFMGLNSGINVTPTAGATSTGVRNIGIGDSTLTALTTGDNNIAMGMYTLQSLTTGNYNTAIGEHSLTATTTGVNNNALGALALSGNTTGSYNSAIGSSALAANTTGSGNLAFGDSSLSANTTGNDNTAFGFDSGTTNATGSGITLLGSFTNVTSDGLFNATAVGYNAHVNQSNAIVLGDIGANAVNVGIGTLTPSAVLHISTASTSTDRIRITDTVGTALNEFQITATGATIFQDRTDGTSTFSILKNSGAGMFSVNTASNYISVGGTSNEVRFGIGVAAPTANLTIASALANDRVLVTDTTGGGTVNVFRIDSTGVTTFQDRTDAAITFNVNNAAGTSMFQVDTRDKFIEIGNGGASTAATARLGIGDMGCTDTISPTAAGCDWIGEEGTTDTDILKMHGSAGTVLTYGYGSGTTGIRMLGTGTNAGFVGINDDTPDFQLTVTASTAGGGVALEAPSGTAVAYKIYSNGTSTGVFAYANAGSDWATGTGAGDTVIGSQNNGTSIISGNSTRIRLTSAGAVILNNLSTITGTGNSALCVTSGNQILKAASSTNCNPSSARYKDNIQTMQDKEGLSIIQALRPVSFAYKSDPTQANHYGLIAEEVYPILPEVVDLDSQGLPAAIDYEYIVPNLIKAIQQQQAEIQGIQQGVWTGGIVSNDSTFNGMVTFNGGAQFNGAATFSGAVTFNNNVTFSSNTAGTATISAGQHSVTVTFSSAHAVTPVVNATPKDFVPAGFRVTNVSSTQFTIELQTPATSDVHFGWSALDAAGN